MKAGAPVRRSKRARDGATEPTRARRRIVYAPVTFSEENGVRFLHFGTEWVQGAMRLARPDTIELEYAQQMMAWSLFIEAPLAIAQLGLGAAALTRFCRKHYPKARVTAVELNPAVVVAARTMFGLHDDDARLAIRIEDAETYVHDADVQGTLDALQVDLYDATARGPVLESAAFYAACRRCLRWPGVLTVNLFGVHASFARNLRSLDAAFDGRIVALPEVHAGNRVALAFNGPPLDVPWLLMHERAAVVASRLGLPTSRWVVGLRAAVGDTSTFRI